MKLRKSDKWKADLALHIQKLNTTYKNLHGGYHIPIGNVGEFYRKTIKWDNPANYDSIEWVEEE